MIIAFWLALAALLSMGCTPDSVLGTWKLSEDGKSINFACPSGYAPIATHATPDGKVECVRWGK